MKIPKRGSGSSGDGDLRPGPSTGITAENYPDRCSAYMRGKGNRGVVIRAIEGTHGSAATQEPATDAQWIAWMGYFRRKGIPVAFALSRGMATVPCEWPEDFDGECEFSDRSAMLRPLAPRAGAARSHEVARGLDEMAASLGGRNQRVRPFSIGDLSPRLAEEYLADLKGRSSEPCAPLGAFSRPKVVQPDEDDYPPPDAPLEDYDNPFERAR